MKKYFIILFFPIITGLKSYSQDAEFVIAKNADVSITADDGTQIVAKDVYSMQGDLKRTVQLFNPKTNQLIGEASIRLQAAPGVDNMYELIEQNPEKFSGTLTIECEGKIVYQKQISNGVASTTDASTTGRAAGELGGGPGPVYNPNLRCTLGNIHDCVAYRIDDMNWWQFGLCLIRAPACYAQQWAYCTVSVCINHMQYTNPY
jgi:hypothetical protein